jgi:hypothetical protein
VPMGVSGRIGPNWSQAPSGFKWIQCVPGPQGSNGSQAQMGPMGCRPRVSQSKCLALALSSLVGVLFDFVQDSCLAGGDLEHLIYIVAVVCFRNFFFGKYNLDMS